jgi:nitroreductase
MIGKLIRNLRQQALYYLEVYRDSRRYLGACDWAGAPIRNRSAHLLGDIIRKYHVVEKALAMPEFRPGSAADVVKSLIVDLEAWEKLPNNEVQSTSQISAAHGVLESYLERHQELNFDVSETFREFQPREGSDPKVGGANPYAMNQNLDWSGFKQFLRGRRSLRSFDASRMPTPEVLHSIARTALKSPSVCNRQTGRLHVFTGGKVNQLLEYQTGNRGFGHQVPVLFVVTTDMRFFLSRKERNQPGIDGGLFALQTVLAIQSEGMGSVCLNWCVDHNSDLKLREISGVPEHEKVIMLIGCGYPSSEALSPISQRYPAEAILTIH